MRAVVLACLLAACDYSRGQLGGDGSIDGPDGPAGCTSFSTILDTCTTSPTAGLTIGGGGVWTYDTDTNTLTSPTNMMTHPPHVVVAATDGPIDVLLVTTFTLDADTTLRVTGATNDRAFGIVATGAVEIRGVIDASVNGAGARDDSACGTAVGRRGGNSANGAGGSGGGAFKGNGGGGSKGDAGNTNGGAGGIAVARPASPIGGCDGGDGGDGDGNGGPGGDGGGAVYIASATMIQIFTGGVIDANGGGGAQGGNNDDGGGGGGSGGMIVLEADSVTIAGIVVANGGGGGEGSNGNPGATGLRSDQPAPGGAGGDSAGGDGAAGGARTGFDGVTTNDVQNEGGGGGGGGVGFIAIHCATPMTSNGLISPPFEAWP